MPEKLTFEDALKEFPKECETIMTAAAAAHGASFDMEYFRKHAIVGKQSLTWAALQWLAGKIVKDKTIRTMVGGGGTTHWYQWPDDMFRFLLEDVREHLEA